MLASGIWTGKDDMLYREMKEIFTIMIKRQEVEMKIMRIKEGQIFCKKKCIGNISGRVPIALKLRIPASHYSAIGTCHGCGDTIDVHNAGKVIKKEEE